MKLGKIAKSNHQPAQQQQHQRTAPSPSMLPEDREVTDILTQRQVCCYRLLIEIHSYFVQLLGGVEHHVSIRLSNSLAIVSMISF